MAIKYNIENQEANNSFALLRTNPKLTSNLKLVVDSSGDIFLSSFKANKSLSKISYQKFEVKPDGFYPNDVSRFYKDIQLNERFEVLRKSSDLTPYSDYEFQYEDQYNYGATFNTTKLYDEQYKMFAPVWLDRKIPGKFIIYRIKDADYSNDYDEDTIGQNGRILELLKNATIVKTYDLSQESKIGKYLHNFVYDSGVPNSPIHFSFGNGAETEFKGIDTINGGFASKTESLSDQYLKKDSIEIDSNEFITEGFERNGLISANLVNLEFLFDDAGAENYKIYRYFGIYADTIPEAEFNIHSIDANNNMIIEPSSFKSYYDVEAAGLTHLDMFPSTKELELPTLNYVFTGSNQYLHVKNGVNIKNNTLPISNNSEINIGAKFKKYRNKVQAETKKISHKGYLKLNIIAVPNQNDRFFIGDKTEIKINNYNLYDFTCTADPNIAQGTFFNNTTRFSLKGGLNQIAMAIGNLIKDITNYNVIIKDNSVIVEDYADGDNRRRLSFGVFKQNLVDFIEVEVGSDDPLKTKVNQSSGDTEYYYNEDLLDVQSDLVNDWDLFSTLGGSKKGAAFLVKDDELGDIKVGQYLKDKKLSKYTKISAITSEYLDDNLNRVILQEPIKLPSDCIIQLYTKFTPEFGKFNAYPLKDFNFDFHDESNSVLHELEYLEDVEFLGLSPLLEKEDPDVPNEYTEIKSEYNRLSENLLKETAIKSRVIPYILKFALKEGTNARNLPYVLNANEGFGPDNLSPNIDLESGRTPDNLNMEHFHFNKMPDGVSASNNTGMYSYVDFKNNGGLTTEMLKSTDLNYFELYLNWNGYLNRAPFPEWIHDTHKKIYTQFIEGSGELESSTVFRGLRYLYKRRKELVKEEPTEFIKTSETNGYKFSTIVNYESDESITSNSVTYEVIKNDVFKFICVYININAVLNGKTSISRKDAYQATDMTDSNGVPVSTDISFNIDLSPSYVNFGDIGEPYGEFVVTTDIITQLQENGNFLNEITKDEEDNYSWLYFEVDSLGGATYAIKVIDVISDNEILVSNRPISFDPQTGNTNSTFLQDGQLDEIDWSSTTFKYWNAGKAGWKNLFEEIVSYRYAQRFNQFGEIEYTTIKESGEFKNEFVLEVQDGVEFVKPSILQTSSDGDRPKSYQLVSAEIGKVISKRPDGGYYTILRRMNGDYIPIFRDVISFTDVYTHHKLHIPEFGETVVHMVGADDSAIREHLIYDKYKNKHIAFSSYKNTESDYGFIKNMYFHKVNNENVKNLLKLSETSDKLPLYPAVGEIAIDYKDINVLKSKYSDDYFTKSTSGGGSEKAHGTLTPVELKAFMASSVMKVKDTYSITRFTSKNEAGLDSLDSIRRDGLNEAGIHWIETDSQIIADFYLPKSIYEELLEDGIYDKYKKYVNPENSFGDKDSIEDDLEEYVYSNIVNRFIIDNIQIYGIKGKNLETGFVNVDSENELQSEGYLAQTNFDIQGYQKDPLSFRLIYNKKSDYKYNLKIGVKIQA